MRNTLAREDIKEKSPHTDVEKKDRSFTDVRRLMFGAWMRMMWTCSHMEATMMTGRARTHVGVITCALGKHVPVHGMGTSSLHGWMRSHIEEIDVTASEQMLSWFGPAWTQSCMQALVVGVWIRAGMHIDVVHGHDEGWDTDALGNEVHGPGRFHGSGMDELENRSGTCVPKREAQDSIGPLRSGEECTGPTGSHAREVSRSSTKRIRRSGARCKLCFKVWRNGPGAAEVRRTLHKQPHTS